MLENINHNFQNKKNVNQNLIKEKRLRRVDIPEFVLAKKRIKINSKRQGSRKLNKSRRLN